MCITAFSDSIMLIGVTYLLIHVVGTGVVGAWWGMTAETLFRAAACLIWFRTGRWKKIAV